MKQSPTPQQRAALEAFGIAPPPTFVTCRGFLVFLKNASTHPEELAKRVAIIKDAQARFTGQPIQHMDGRSGRVRYVLYRGPAGRPPAKWKQGHRYTHPLDAWIDWDDGTASATSINSLQITGA